MNRRFICVMLIAFAIIFVPISALCNANEYYCVSENYEETKEKYPLKGTKDSIIQGTAEDENESRYLSPGADSTGRFWLGYYTLDRILKGTVTIDFRAKISETSGMTFMGFALREEDDTKAMNFYITDKQLRSQWRYYRVIVNFTEKNIEVYTSDNGFDTLGLLSSSAYTTTVVEACENGMTGADRIQFHNCLLDDFSIYAGGNTPTLNEKPLLYRDASDIKLAYSYYDSEDDAENATEIRWQISNDGLNFENIESEYKDSYRLSSYDVGKYIRAIVTPKSVCYPQTGSEYSTDAYYINSTVDVNVYDEEGKELTTFSKNMENLKADIKFSPVDKADNVTAILAAYSIDGKLLDCTLKKLDRNLGDSEVSFNDINLSNLSEPVAYFKGFIWSDLKELVPVDTIGKKDAEVSAIIKEALQKLNLEKQELSEVNELYEKGDCLGAIRKYKKIFFDNLESFNQNGLASSISGTLEKANRIVDEDIVTLTSGSGEIIQIKPGEAGNYNWLYPDVTFLNYGTRLGWLEDLMYAYSYTGEERYLKKWLDIRADFDENFQKQYEQQLENGNELCGVDIRFIKVGQLYNGGRINNRVQSLAFAVKKDRAAIERLFDDISFAKMIVAQSEDLKDISISTSTPNQFMYGVRATTVGELIFPTIEVSNKLQSMNDNLAEFIDENYNTDGGEGEMSFHYNYDTFSYYKSLEKLYQAKGTYPLWFTEFSEYIEKKARLMVGVLTPSGNVPNLSMDYDNEKAYDMLSKYSYVTEDEVGSSVFSQLFGDKSSVPKFTSIAFPYTGYYAMRNSWDNDSQYLFFNGTRFGGGHTEMNKLEVQYHAYGERLLMSSPESYSSADADTPYNRYFASGYGNNTVMVDGNSQHRDVNDTSDFSAPEKGLWHTSENFDYADNTYENGYNTYLSNWDEREAAVKDVKHKRQVLMDKENIIALVVDEMQTEGEHSYSLVWNFDDKFNSEEMVVADVANKKITAYANDGKAGLELYNFGKATVSYLMSCGEKEGSTYKGWYLPKYGTSYKPSVHTETEFSGSGNQKIFTLLNPTEAGASKIESYEELDNGAGFSLRLKNGNQIVCLSGNAEYDDITFNGNLLYLMISDKGIVKGIAVDAEEISIGDASYVCDKKSFELGLKDGSITVSSDIEPASGFSWNNALPVYKN